MHLPEQLQGLAPALVARAAPPETTGLTMTIAVADTGTSLNDSAPALPYSHGLNGVSQDTNYLLMHILVVSFCALLIATFGYKWAQMGKSYVRLITSLGNERDQRYWQSNATTFWPWIKQHLLYAPLGKVRHNRELQLSKAIAIGTLPSRFHTLLLVLYLSSNLAYCLILDWNRPNHYSVVAELRGRSGILATANMIPTILFAMRNNPLIPILKVSYDTFNLLHRWCARMVILEAIIHVSCFLYNNISAGSSDGVSQIHLALSTSTSYQWGMVATCVFIFMGIASLGPIRHAFYEFFLNSHRFLAWLALLGVLLHVVYAKLPFESWVVLCFLIWGLEWSWRIGRVVYYNFTRQRGLTKVTVEALPAEACRVTFHLARPIKWRPGCHVHAYLPAVSWLSSHPFSVAWAAGDTDALRRRTLYDEKAPATRTATDQQSTIELIDALHAPVTTISLVTKARSGMTLQLYTRAAASPSGTYTTVGMLEGLYGGHDQFASYGSVVLFAGGVGITHCLGYLRDLLHRQHLGLCATRRILLVWSVPTPEALAWVRPWMDTILRMPGRRDVLRIHIYVTKPRHRRDVVSDSGAVRMLEGRCKPAQVLEKEMRERVGALAVSVCGPGAFADSVRAAARAVVQEGVVEFVEEAFTY